MTTVEAASLLLSLLAVAISVCAVYAVRNATRPDANEELKSLLPEPERPPLGPSGVSRPATDVTVLPGGWHVPADQVIPPVSEWPGYEEAGENPREEWEPSPFLTAHQRTEVLRISREDSVMAALSREAEILARRGRRAKA